jgi:hypothetical protein
MVSPTALMMMSLLEIEIWSTKSRDCNQRLMSSVGSMSYFDEPLRTNFGLCQSRLRCGLIRSLKLCRPIKPSYLTSEKNLPLRVLLDEGYYMRCKIFVA